MGINNKKLSPGYYLNHLSPEEILEYDEINSIDFFFSTF